MAAKSLAGIVHDELVTLFQAAGLAVAGRSVNVIRELPEEAFSQRALPVLVIERPRVVEVAPWGYDYERRTVRVPIALVDGLRAAPGGADESNERIALLEERVRAAMAAEPHLRMARLHVFESLCSWDTGEVTVVGNNLLSMACVLTLTATVAKGAELEG
ncbi:hypothetical protein GC173_08130 [bacterium]|nr:hypothetical protein [bacterium]